MPSTTKVINVLNKGIDDRMTKNGECLRKYADMKTRWDALKVKIKRVDHEMQRKLVMDIERERGGWLRSLDLIVRVALVVSLLACNTSYFEIDATLSCFSVVCG